MKILFFVIIIVFIFSLAVPFILGESKLDVSVVVINNSDNSNSGSVESTNSNSVVNSNSNIQTVVSQDKKSTTNETNINSSTSQYMGGLSSYKPLDGLFFIIILFIVILLIVAIYLIGSNLNKKKRIRKIKRSRVHRR